MNAAPAGKGLVLVVEDDREIAGTAGDGGPVARVIVIVIDNRHPATSS